MSSMRTVALQDLQDVARLEDWPNPPADGLTAICDDNFNVEPEPIADELE